MGWPQLVFGCLLAAGVAAVAGVAGWRQLRALSLLDEAFDLSDDERQRQRRQGRRRLLTCVLMAVLAVQLLGGLAFLEAPAQRLADQRDAAPADTPMTDDQRFFARVYGYYWISFLLLLLALVLVTAWDLWVLRRQAQRERRQLLDDRKDMIERELDRLREERNRNG